MRIFRRAKMGCGLRPGRKAFSGIDSGNEKRYRKYVQLHGADVYEAGGSIRIRTNGRSSSTTTQICPACAIDESVWRRHKSRKIGRASCREIRRKMRTM